MGKYLLYAQYLLGTEDMIKVSFLSMKFIIYVRVDQLPVKRDAKQFQIAGDI